MSNVYKKLIGISLAMSSIFTVNSFVGAVDANQDLQDQQIIPVINEKEGESKEEESKEDKEVFSPNATVGAGILEKGVEKGLEEGADVLKNELQDQKEEHEQKSSEMKQQFSSFLDDVSNNLEDLNKKHEEAQQKASEQVEQANQLNEKEDQLEQMKKSVELKDEINKNLGEFKKTNEQAIDNVQNKLYDSLDQGLNSNSEPDKK